MPIVDPWYNVSVLHLALHIYRLHSIVPTVAILPYHSLVIRVCIVHTQLQKNDLFVQLKSFKELNVIIFIFALSKTPGTVGVIPIL